MVRSSLGSYASRSALIFTWYRRGATASEPTERKRGQEIKHAQSLLALLVLDDCGRAAGPGDARSVDGRLDAPAPRSGDDGDRASVAVERSLKPGRFLFTRPTHHSAYQHLWPWWLARKQHIR